MHFSKHAVTKLVRRLVQETGQVEGCWEGGGVGFSPRSATDLLCNFVKVISPFFSHFAHGHNEAWYYLLEDVGIKW